jgi:2-polyprenyl-3-methyl-5-hydroxy-6-metoxy-1,4-benzoquinol methylase
MTELGKLGELDQAGRDAFYSDCEYHPTPTQAAFALTRVQWLFVENEKKPFHKVLDLGCNDGFCTRWLLNGPFIELLVGIDLNKPAIEGANKLLEEVRFPECAEYHCMSWDEFPEGKLFDVVVASELIEHFPEEGARRLLRTVNDFLEPGGRAYLTTPHVDGRWGSANPDPAHIFLLNPLQVVELVREELGYDCFVETVQEIIHFGWVKPE